MFDKRTAFEFLLVCLTIAAAVAVVQLDEQRETEWVQTQISAGSWDTVTHRLDQLGGTAFCHKLVGQFSLAVPLIERHNLIASVYNEALDHGALALSERIHEPPMDNHPIPRSAVGSMLNLGIDPWEDCAHRYGVFGSASMY